MHTVEEAMTGLNNHRSAMIEVEEQRRKCPITSIMQHSKSGNYYTIVGYSIREEDLEPLVTYAPVTNHNNQWTRTLKDFYGVVDLPQGSVPRFVHVL